MSYNFIELFSIISLILGCFFILSGSLGLIKLPDVFSRIHAAGLIDTSGIRIYCSSFNNILRF
jgi:multicomponent Na+:H+ antiporter subunit G